MGEFAGGFEEGEGLNAAQDEDTGKAVSVLERLKKFFKPGEKFAEDEFKESNIKRDNDGKFGSGGSANTSAQIEQVIDKALNNPNERQKVVIGSVDKKLADAAKNAGFSIDGFTHDIDVSGVRHAFLNHGNAKTEQLRGQLPITGEDIKKIPEIIKNYDKVDFAGKSKIGRDLINYTKKMNDGTVYYVEEIRTGQKTLTIQTLWKGKGR